jgi:cellulose synthase/poly-beta-1,6-N-acetylglucosamine synthase-like glycosyltransferase
LNGALQLNYENYEIIVSDNGKNKSVTENLQKFCEENQILFHHKKDDRGFKAGNINAVLHHTRGEYIVVLDSDHIPEPDLLNQFATVINDPTVGYIQAKVKYRNVKRLYQSANSILYTQFYEVIEAGKDPRGMVLFNGTTGCFRKSILLEVGGFSEDTLIEDIDTSMKILIQGYKGRFLNFIGSSGLVPETASSQIAQLWRWTHGACTILRLRFRSLITATKISAIKRLELLLNAMAFFSGASILFFISLLTLMITFEIPILRFSGNNFNTVYIMPSLISASYTLAVFLGILWEEREDRFFKRIITLIPFFLFSLGSFLFLISGIVEGLLLKNTPHSETSVWDRQFSIKRNSFIALIFTFSIIFLALLSIPNEFAFFIIGGSITWIFAPLMLLWEEFFPPIPSSY